MFIRPSHRASLSPVKYTGPVPAEHDIDARKIVLENRFGRGLELYVLRAESAKTTVKKPGIAIDIPGFGKRVIYTIVSDYTGTLSLHGKLTPGVRSRLLGLKKLVDLEIVTADTYGTARQQLKGIVVPNMLRKKRQDIEKCDFVKKFNLRHVAAFGNGNNDRLLLAAVKKSGGIGIAVDNGEGCALDALLAANIFISGAAGALDLLLNPTALKATLRF